MWGVWGWWQDPFLTRMEVIGLFQATPTCSAGISHSAKGERVWCVMALGQKHWPRVRSCFAALTPGGTKHQAEEVTPRAKCDGQRGKAR